MKSPTSLPVGLSIGVRVIRPTSGIRFAIRCESQTSASGPSTRYLPKLWISLMPTASRTARHSAATGAKAFERRKVGCSNAASPSGANQLTCSRPYPAPKTAFCAAHTPYAGVVTSPRAAGSSSFGYETANRRW